MINEMILFYQLNFWNKLVLGPENNYLLRKNLARKYLLKKSQQNRPFGDVKMSQ